MAKATGGTYRKNSSSREPQRGMQAARVQLQPATRPANSQIRPPATKQTSR
jgi:hypothetical protein